MYTEFQRLSVPNRIKKLGVKRESFASDWGPDSKRAATNDENPDATRLVSPASDHRRERKQRGGEPTVLAEEKGDQNL